MNFAPPGSGNPRGPYAPSRERARFGSEFISALLRDFRQGGPKAIERVRRTQPGVYLKVLALLVPREHKVEHSNAVSGLSDEELEAAIEHIKASLAARAGCQAKVIEGTVEPVAIETTAQAVEHKAAPRKRPNRLLAQVDTAVGPKDRRPRKRKVPSPSSA